MSSSNGSRAANAEPVPVITIDGPVGSGKGTIAARLARRLGWNLLDSGALYRLVALQALRQGVAQDDAAGLGALAENLEATVTFEHGVLRVYLDGADVTGELRVEAVSNLASRVAALPVVRQALARPQRDAAKAPGLVADGRDMGTVVFPDAALKIYLTATVRARAERRYKQLKEKGESVNLPRLFRDLEKRDQRDTNRAVAPLEPAADAILLDSTDLSVDQVLKKILKLVEEKNLAN